MWDDHQAQNKLDYDQSKNIPSESPEALANLLLVRVLPGVAALKGLKCAPLKDSIQPPFLFLAPSTAI